MDKILTPHDLHDYQVEAVKHQLAHDESMLFLDMGLGKTVITLTSLAARKDQLRSFGTLVLAPLRVCQSVWAQEAQKWSHLQGLRFSRILGDRNLRERGLRTHADIYLLNYENLVWAVDRWIDLYLRRGLHLPFDTIVFDEVTKLKDVSTERHEALRKILPYTRSRHGLTGTPASNGYIDLFGQFLAVDLGKRLGVNITDFRNKYCVPMGAYQFGVTSTAEKIIEANIADITLQMDSSDYLDLPKVTVNDIYVDLTPEQQEQYRRLETEMFIQLEDTSIEVFNAAALTGKCLQAANGALYDEDHNWKPLHSAKLDALEDIVEEAAGKPVLCCYEFVSDKERILKRFPKAVHIGGSLTEKKLAKIIADWNAGKIPLLIGHPASMGHGLNLQYGGNTVVWFGLNWSLDLYLQANARIDRQGQTHPVIIHRILTRNTLDEAVRDALKGKATTQDKLRRAITEYRNQKLSAAA